MTVSSDDAALELDVIDRRLRLTLDFEKCGPTECTSAHLVVRAAPRNVNFIPAGGDLIRVAWSCGDDDSGNQDAAPSNVSSTDGVLGIIHANLDGVARTWYVVEGDVRGEPYASGMFIPVERPVRRHERDAHGHVLR